MKDQHTERPIAERPIEEEIIAYIVERRHDQREQVIKTVLAMTQERPMSYAVSYSEAAQAYDEVMYYRESTKPSPFLDEPVVQAEPGVYIRSGRYA